MKVEVNYDRCEGHEICVKLASSVFAIGDDDEQVRVLDATPDESLREAVELAASRCPRQAITVID